MRTCVFCIVQNKFFLFTFVEGITFEIGRCKSFADHLEFRYITSRNFCFASVERDVPSGVLKCFHEKSIGWSIGWVLFCFGSVGSEAVNDAYRSMNKNDISRTADVGHKFFTKIFFYNFCLTLILSQRELTIYMFLDGNIFNFTSYICVN